MKGRPFEGHARVSTARLDSWLGGTEGGTIGCVDLIKIDAEGFDLAVLQGAATMLDRHRPVVIVEVWAEAARFVGGWRSVATSCIDSTCVGAA